MGRKKNRRRGAPTTRTICKARGPEEPLPRPEDIIIENQEKESTNILAPIDIHDRLTYPLVPPSGVRQPEEDSDEEEHVELNFWPRSIFVSSLCLICMERSKILCESCGMVSYCSAKHEKQGFEKHRELCKVLKETSFVERSLPKVEALTADEYRLYRFQQVGFLQIKIGRPLEMWEKEVVLYPRVCRVCRAFSKELNSCPSCGVETTCELHSKEHEAWCEEFRVFRRCVLMQYQHGYVNPEIANVHPKEPLALPDNFDRLIAQIYGRSPYYLNMDCHTYSTLSHMSTIPLTALYSMQISYPNWRDMDNFAIHVIGAEFQFECLNLIVWEKFFLHFLPNLKTLTLRFVGPEMGLPSVPMRLLTKVKICSACKSSRRAINVTFHPGKFYHDVANRERLEKPDLVCLFNPGLYRETGFEGKDTWPRTIKEFCEARAPVTVTSYTKHEIPRDMLRIRSICDIEIVLEPRRNPFASLKPDRNFISEETAPLIYKNYCMAIVKGKS
ncbi:hypothetical protein KM043_005681 [Ampulex compressa]|nr:hypothetical protein KM043_005681 [Ampulex compressa]